MGHIRLGKLPKTKLWKEVIALLGEEPEDLVGIAAGVLRAGGQQLGKQFTIDAAGDAFATLVRLAQASERGQLAEELQGLGISTGGDASLLAALGDLSDRLRSKTPASSGAGHFQDMAALALRRALVDTVGTQGPGLFGSSIHELEAGFKRWSGGDQFGRLTRLFFGDFVARVLQASVDRELANHTAITGSFGEPGQSRQFAEALDRYARETAAIVQRFATDWYAKYTWHSRGIVDRKMATRFTSYALTKLRSDLEFARAGV